MQYTLIVMAVGLLAMELFAEPFSKIFGLSGQTQELCIGAMRIVSLSFLFAGANIAYQGIFQALDAGVESLVISVCRQFLFVLPVAWGFSLLARESMDYMWLVWMTFLIAEFLSVVIATIFMRRINKRVVENLEEECFIITRSRSGGEPETITSRSTAAPLESRAVWR